MLLVVIVLSNNFGVLTPDTKPEVFLRPGQTARRFVLSWLDTPNLGSANYNVGTGVLAALFAPLEALGMPAWLIQRTWRIALLLIGAAGARMVVRELVKDGLGRQGAAIAGIAAAVAYTANPYVIVGGGTTPTAQPYALLPWLVLIWLRGFRAPSWRMAVLAALVLAGMGSINAGVVPLMQLVVIVPVVAHALFVEGHRIWPVAWLITRTGMVYALLSAHWLVPAVAALGIGASVADATESLAAINMANSYPEVLRGLGMWTMYGVRGTGSFDPNRLVYLTSIPVVALSFGGPVLAALGVRLTHSPARLFGATSVLVSGLLMVGTFSAGPPTPWSRLVETTVNTVPGLVAFRTTNKFGAVLELGLAVLIGLGAAAVAARATTVRRRVGAVGAAGVVTAASIAPALTGGLFWYTMDIPAYWHQVGDEVNAHADESRVLMVPGVSNPRYTWGYFGPDEIGPSLFTRPFAYRSATPTGGEHAAAMLASVDRRLHNGTLPEGTISTLAAYLGVGDVIGRYDLRDVSLDGEAVEAQLETDPGLGPVTLFGEEDAANGAPAAATRRTVTASSDQPSARVRDGRGVLLVDGTGAALPGLVAAELTDDVPAILLAADLADVQLAEALRRGARLVITDSNARREWSNVNPTGVGPILPATAEPSSTRALFTADAQTTAEVRGNVRVESKGRGLLFGPYAYGGVEQAFDEDKTTAWRFGNFGSGVGNAVVIEPHIPRVIPSVNLTPLQTSGQWITDVKVTATTTDRVLTREVELTPWSTFEVPVDLTAEPVTRLEIEVTGVAGDGIAAVGFREISVPGVQLERVVTVSSHLSERAPSAAALAAMDLDEVALDVVLERDVGAESGLSDGEPGLVREFTIPDGRAMTVSGTVRLASGIADSRIDRLSGTAGSTRAESSSRLFFRPDARASMAIDATGSGDPDLESAWRPNDPVVGEWIAIDIPTQELAAFTITQPEIGPYATTALVSVNDGDPFEAELGPGTTEVELPAVVDADRVRVLITGTSGSGFIQIQDIGLPRIARTAPHDSCRTVAWIDQTPIRAHVGAALDDLLQGEPVAFTPCGGPIQLDQGLHRVRAVSDFSLDLLHLSTAGAEADTPPAVSADIVTHKTDLMDVALPSGCVSCVVSTGQSYDPRWRAQLDGVDLGAPHVVDGFAAGWTVEAQPGSRVTMFFGPRSAVIAAWWVSGLALVGCLAAWAAPALRRMHLNAKHRGGDE